MTRVDILLLEMLNKSNDKINARKMYNNLKLLEISCCISNVRQRLEILKSKNLVVIHWKEGNKLYSISPSGKEWVSELKNQLQKI